MALALRLRRAAAAAAPLLRLTPQLPNPNSSLSRPHSMLRSQSFRSSPPAMAVDRNNSFKDMDKIDENTILFEGCDYEHWLITMDFPKDPKPSPEEMVETYVQTLAKVVGSVEEAKKRMYACSTTTYQGFQAVMSEEMSEKFKGLPGVVFILPDSYIDPANKQYGGDKYDNGVITPRPPPIQYRQQRPNNFNQPRYSGQREPMPAQRGYQPRDPVPPMQGLPNAAPPLQNSGPPIQNQGQSQPNYGAPQHQRGSSQPGYAAPHTGFAPQQPGYAPQQPGYAPQRPGYAAQQPGYTPQQPGYTPRQPGYAPQQPGYAPQQPGYAPRQPGYAPQQPGYAPQQQRGYAPQQPGYGPPPGQDGRSYGPPGGRNSPSFEQRGQGGGRDFDQGQGGNYSPQGHQNFSVGQGQNPLPGPNVGHRQGPPSSDTGDSGPYAEGYPQGPNYSVPR